ncbi:MAG TPA: tetratricopeptide repeat protein [Oculatellaceae cyanobacterium]
MGHSKVVARALKQASEPNKSNLLPLWHSGKFTAYSLNFLLMSCVSATALSGVSVEPARATDFSHAQHVFVPPTSIPRHFDSESLNYGNATGDSPDIYPTHDLPANGASTKTFTQNGRSVSKTIYSGSKQSQARGNTTSSANVDAPPAMNAFVSQARTKAQALVKSGQLAAAEEMLQTDLKAVPKSQGLQTELANVRVARAKYALKTGDTALATQHAEAALLVQPSNSAAKSVLAEINNKDSATTSGIADHLAKAKVLIGQASYAAANSEIQAAIKIKETADAHVALGDLASKQGNVETARSEYAKALQMDPESGPALRQNGIFKLHSNDVVGANKDLSRALIINAKDKEAATALQKIWHDEVAKNPTSANAHLGLARAYQLSEELTLAQTEYREVVRLDPHHPSLPTARQSFKLALAKQESVKCLQAAKTLEDAGAFTEAHQKAVEAVNISPSCVSARLYQGAICEKLNLYSEAHDAYMAALKYDPKNAIAARHLHTLQQNANSAELSSAAGTAQSNGSSSGSASSSTPNVPAGMYVFKGWQFGHPLANNNNSATDAPAQTSTAYGAAQTASYSYASNSQPSMGNATQALASNPATPNSGDPAAPMPLQGTPPPQTSAASTASHVNAFANFFSSLREATMNQKAQTRQFESAMSNALGGSSSSSSLGGSSLGGLDGGSGASAAANLGSTPPPPVSTPSQSSISSVLAQAAQAVARAGGSSSTSSGSGAGASSAATSGSSSSGSAAGNGSNTVSINVNGTNIQISNTGGSSTSSGTGTDASNSGQSLSGAAWDAAPTWLKNKFPNMTQQDFTAIAGKFKGSLKSKLQALGSQQKAAATGQGPQVTAAQAAQTLASALPANVTINGQPASTAVSNMVKENVAGNVLPQTQMRNPIAQVAPAASSLQMAQAASSLQMAPTTDSLLTAPPVSSLPVSTGFDPTEQEVLSKAGQDSPTMAPPEVVPDSASVSTAAAAAALPMTPSISAASASSPTDPLLRGQLPTTAAGTTSSTTAPNGAGLQGQTQSLALLPTSSSSAASVSSGLNRTDLNSSAADPNSNDNSNASVVLELQGFTPTPTGIRLKVVIKNSRTKSLPLPDSAKAVIHMPGQPDKEAKISFTAKEVSPSGIVQGTVKVPGHDLNPAADLVLPNFLPTTFADRDVHLTVPISALVK